jgi:hypothetical protein
MEFPAVRRARGRPPKYRDEEERRAARRRQVLNAVKTHRSKKKQTDASATGESAISLATPPGFAVGFVLSNDGQEPRNEVVSSNSLMPSSSARPAVPKLDDEALEMKLPAPNDLIMRNATLLVNNLLEDFLTLAGQSEDWWPWFQASDHIYSNKIGAKLLGYSNVASFSACIGKARSDSGLISLGQAAYGDTLSILRRYTEDKYIRQVGIILVLMTNDMINHELSEFLVSSDCSGDRWSIHALAGHRIIEQAGPDIFRLGLGTNVLVGSVPRMVSMHSPSNSI